MQRLKKQKNILKTEKISATLKRKPAPLNIY